MDHEQKGLNAAESVERELLKSKARSGGLLSFTLFTKPDYQVNWHHKYLCNILNKFIKKEIKRLMIFLPPRHGKSELVSRRLPALLHGLYPNDEVMSATYSGDLAGDMTTDVQRIMDRPEYQELFPNSRITPEGSVSKYARNRHEHELLPIEGKMSEWTFLKGSYRSQGVGGSFGGRGANWILVDDVVKNREEADSKVTRENVWKFYTSTLDTRQEGHASILLTMTRWHEDDLAGRLLKLSKVNPEADQWTVIRFPAVRDDLDNQSDPREVGQALWPDKFDIDYLNRKKATSIRDFTALYQQRPTAEGGIIFKEQMFKFYMQLPPRFDQMIQSWDMASKDKLSSDFYVGQVWGRVRTDKYLIAQVRGQWSFPMACQKLVELSRSYPNAYKKLLEAKANGPAVMQTLQTKVSGMVEVEPRGDKVARANAVSPEFESGCVWLPHPSIAPWIHEYLSEMMEFPNGSHDDQVDATTQAIDELRKAQMLYVPTAGHGSGTIF